MDLIFNILINIVGIYRYILIIHIILSWFPQVRQTSFGRFISSIAEPFLEPFRRIIPSIGMFDFSPIVAILALHFAQIGLANLSRFF